ncbi:MAG: spermidine/putrescine ABC transporter substrate-binding protein [Chloroflexota bacterium]
MKKLNLLLALAMVFALALPAIAQDDMEAWSCPDGYEGQTLSIFNWSTYIAEDTIPNFEEACGVTVEYSIFESSEEALSVIRQVNPGYDIVVPSDFTAGVMIEEGLVQTLDYDLIPNAANLYDTFRETPYDPTDEYTIPWQWGTIGIGYSTEAFPDGITSWEQLWEYDGDVSWLEDQRSTIGVGLNMLGYDPNSMVEDEIEEAAEYLIDNGENVVAIAGDDGQELLQRGDVDAAIEYNGDIFQIIFDCECDDFAYVIPEEGTVVWTDVMVIPSDAPNAELAMVFMNYMLDPVVSADLANFVAYGSPNQVSVEMGLIDEELLTDPGIYPTAETQERLFPIENNQETEELINDVWEEIKLEVGG